MTESDQYQIALNAAPSDIRSEEPTFARILGLGGLGLAVLGTAAIIANQYGPRFVGTSGGIVCAFFGLLALLYHAFRDGDVEFRRLYTFAGLLFLIAAVVVSFLPGRPAGVETERQVGYYLMPWTPLTAIVAWLFLMAATRHETAPAAISRVNRLLLLVASILTVIPIGLGMAKPELLAGPGILLALVGILYACAYLSRAGTADGLSRMAGIALGILGGLALFFAVARTVFPVVLYDGPRVLKTASQSFDPILLLGRIIVIALLTAGVVLVLRGKSVPNYLRLMTASALGLTAIVFLVGTFTAPLSQLFPPYLVPGGLILGCLGLTYLAISLAYCSDSPFVALVGREVAGFFVSPIAYLVLLGVGFTSAIGYGILILEMTASPGRVVLEPVVGQYWAAVMGAAFVVVMLVPAITMRLFSEEKRTGTLEVLLTAPVGEWSVVLSKFLAAWFFYLVVWLPMGLYLIGLRATGPAFDYRPLLSYYLCQAVCGAGFVAMGLFFSSLTRNQIIAAVLSFAGTFGLLLTVILKSVPASDAWMPIKAVASRLDFLTAWQTALAGQISLSFVAVYASFAAFWLVATVKVLEARRWA
jgi:ABC-2 type transport system permease protein